MKLPKKGDRFRLKQTLPVTGVITFGAPFSDGFKGILPEGEILFLDYDPPEWVKGVWLVPERYEYFEQLFIPEETRKNPEYGSYAVSCSFEELSSYYEPVSWWVNFWGRLFVTAYA